MVLSATLYIVLCLIVAYVGRWSRLRFWGLFLISLAVTPVVTGVILIFIGDRGRPIFGNKVELKNVFKKQVKN